MASDVSMRKDLGMRGLPPLPSLNGAPFRVDRRAGGKPLHLPGHTFSVAAACEGRVRDVSRVREGA